MKEGNLSLKVNNTQRNQEHKTKLNALFES